MAKIGRLFACALSLSSLLAGPLLAAEGEEGGAEDAVPAPIGLDALLRLPSSPATIAPERIGGATRKEWGARFAGARSKIEAAKEALKDAQTQLESLAADAQQWQVAAPGAELGGENSPLSYSLRQEIRSQRQAVEEAQQLHRELQIEANLAGVPESWMGGAKDGS